MQPFLQQTQGWEVLSKLFLWLFEKGFTKCSSINERNMELEASPKSGFFAWSGEGKNFMKAEFKISV